MSALCSPKPSKDMADETTRPTVADLFGDSDDDEVGRSSLLALTSSPLCAVAGESDSTVVSLLSADCWSAWLLPASAHDRQANVVWSLGDMETNWQRVAVTSPPQVRGVTDSAA